MLDTARVQWSSALLGPAFEEFRQAHYPLARVTTSAYSRDLPWVGTMFEDKVLGTIGTKQNLTGTFLWAEKSIPKFLTGDNCKQLSRDEAREGLALWLGAVEARFSDFLPKQAREVAQCKRVDVYHQRPMPAGEVFSHIARCLKRQKGVSLHLTGVEVHNSRELHGRFYDKGLESGNEEFVGVVRHEEQLRGSKAKQLMDLQSCDVDRAAARAVMNARFDGWPAEVECYGFEQLLAQEKQRALCAIVLSECPHLEPALQRTFGRNFFYAGKRLALEAQRRMSVVDLRVPEEAWSVPGV